MTNEKKDPGNARARNCHPARSHFACASAGTSVPAKHTKKIGRQTPKYEGGIPLNRNHEEEHRAHIRSLEGSTYDPSKALIRRLSSRPTRATRKRSSRLAMLTILTSTAMASLQTAIWRPNGTAGRQNKVTRRRKVILPSCTTWAKACPRMRQQRSSGRAKRLNKEIQRGNCSLGSCANLDAACRGTSPRPHSGTEKPPIRGIQKRNLSSASAVSMAREHPKVMPKPSSGLIPLYRVGQSGCENTETSPLPATVAGVSDGHGARDGPIV